MRSFADQKKLLREQIDHWENDLKQYETGSRQTFVWEGGLRRDISTDQVERLKSDIGRFKELLGAYETIEKLSK